MGSAIGLTAHARSRMKQRGIRPEAVECLLDFGRDSFDHRGGVVLYLDKAARRRLARAHRTQPALPFPSSLRALSSSLRHAI
ncbi:MAG TPA: DUF4258 domain-containing protein [Usitatibacter sp.]|nr:DUF4258 domain-containing protein [Usitatibacter sp.]